MTTDRLSDILPLLTARKVPKDQFAEIKSSLTKYSSAVPYHDVGDLGDAIRIIDCSEIPLIRASISTLFESRTVDRISEHHQEEGVTPPTVSENNFDKWSIPFDLPAGFVADTRMIPIAESRDLIPCNQCGGNRQLPCNNCRQHGYLACDKTVNCSVCGGQGTVTESRTVQTERPCAGAMPPFITCEGGYAGGASSSSLSSPDVCTKCNGTGRAIYDDEEYYSVTCHGCRGQCQVVCPTCNGAGRVKCSTCSGSGNVQCEKCKGNGTLLTYLTVKVRFEPSKDDCEIEPSSKAEERLCEQDFDELFHSSNKRYGLEFAKQWSPEKVQNALASCLGGCHDQEHEDKRIVRQEIVVRRATVVKVICEFGTKKSRICLVGKDYFVWSDDDPISQCLQTKLKEASVLWESDNKDDAVEIARRCWYMSQSHSNCERIFSSAALPDELREMADDKKQAEAAGCGWQIGGCLSVFLVLMVIGGVGVMRDEGISTGQVVFCMVCAALSVFFIRYTQNKWRDAKEIDNRLKVRGRE